MARDKEAVEAEVVHPREEMDQVDDHLWEALDLVETALLVAQAADDPQWAALVQAVDVLRWVDQETDLHLLEGQPSPNC